VNPTDLTTSIERACGLKTEIISGTREAEWVFQGVATDAELAKQPLLLLDVGGGSTEFILATARRKFRPQLSARHGAAAGTISARRPADPRRVQRLPRLGKKLSPRSGSSATRTRAEKESGEIRLVGTGGTTSILARIEKKLDRFDREKIERTS